MVALKGKGWQLAPSLAAMFAEADRIAPDRRTASDGTIGDADHRGRVSDHNPLGGFVHAGDLTHDPARGFDAHARVRTLVTRRDPRIKYIISNGRIYGPGSRYGWAGGPYDGNPHSLHAHVSVWPTQVGRFDTSPWFGAAITFPTAPLPSPPSPTVPPASTPPPYIAPQEDDDMQVLIFSTTGDVSTGAPRPTLITDFAASTRSLAPGEDSTALALGVVKTTTPKWVSSATYDRLLAAARR